MKFTAVAIVLLVAVAAINAIPFGDYNYNRNVNNNNNQDRLYSSLYNQLIAQQSGKAGPETEPAVAEDEVSADDAADGEAKNADGSKSHNPYHPSSNYNYNSNTNNNQNIIDSFLLSSLYSQLTSNQGTPGHGPH